jgi:hypothetical protein
MSLTVGNRTAYARPYGKLQRSRPRPAAMQALQELYAAYRAEGMGLRGHPWTCEAATELGRLYVAAWGRLPIPSALRCYRCLPESKVILHLFGTLAAYYVALSPEGAPDAD